jgi:hypothetical protein
VRLQAAELGIAFTELDGPEALLGEDLGDIRPRFIDEVVREEVAIAIDDAQGRYPANDLSHAVQFRFGGLRLRNTESDRAGPAQEFSDRACGVVI